MDHPTRSQRKEIGCIYKEDRLIIADRFIGFPRPGYLIAKGFELNSESYLSFNFKTRNSNALLLFESGKQMNTKFKRDKNQDQVYDLYKQIHSILDIIWLLFRRRTFISPFENK